MTFPTPPQSSRNRAARAYRILAGGVFTLVPLLVIVASALLFCTVDSLAGLTRDAERSHDTREQIQRVFSLLQDVETGERGFVISGQERFLDPYTTAANRLRSELDRLDRMTDAEPAQHRRVARLRAQVDTRLRAVREVVALRRTNSGAAHAAVAFGRGAPAMVAIRSTVAELSTAESADLDRHIALTSARAEHVKLAAGVSVGLLLASLLIAVWLVRRHDRARQAMMERLEQASARHAAIFENTIDAIVTLNPSGSIETLNRAAERMFGYDEAELSRRHASVLVDLAPEDGPLLRELAADQGATREFVGRRKDGSQFPVEVALGSMTLRDGPHFVAALRDISERKEAERLKDEFVSTVSHELRTPLTSIAGSLGLMESGAAGALPEKAARLTHIAKTSSDRLVRLINDLLDVQKIAAGHVRFDLRPLDLREVCGRAAEAMASFGQQHQVSIAYSAPERPLEVEGDADRLIQIASNLLSNAIKFSPKGGEVVLRLAVENDRAVVSVRDRGPGVPEAFQATLFRRFAQADGSLIRKVGGSGLGLAISREIAERHRGGLALAHSSPDGAEFRLDLPLVVRKPAPRRPEGPRLLLCEHDPVLADRIAAALQTDGFAVERATTGSAGEAALRAGGFDALILDLQLGDGEGLQLARRLRADPALKSLPILVVSGGAVADLGGVPVADWITKPVDVRRLRESVAAALNGRGSLSILHVDDDPDLAELVSAALSSCGHLQVARSLAEARQRLRSSRPDLVILDIGLPDGSGLQLLPELSGGGLPPPVIIYSGQEVDTEVVGQVAAVLTKSRVSFDDLARTVRSLARKEQQAA